MSGKSVKQYAYAHARIRGRIGNMPDESVWQRIINAGGLETTIESMSESGLKYWVSDFPRRPEPQEVELRCLTSLLRVYQFVSVNLPERWKETGKWLVEFPHLMQLGAALSAGASEKLLLPGSPFLPLMTLAAPDRAKALRLSDYSIYLEEGRSPESHWVACFESRLPRLQTREQHIIKRLISLMVEHYAKIAADMTSEQLWIARSELFYRLKAVMAGDPFHIGTVLIYALLESIQFERIRAILLLRAYQWPTRLLGGMV